MQGGDLLGKIFGDFPSNADKDSDANDGQKVASFGKVAELAGKIFDRQKRDT